jgi:hypothetical protein
MWQNVWQKEGVVKIVCGKGSVEISGPVSCGYNLKGVANIGFLGLQLGAAWQRTGRKSLRILRRWRRNWSTRSDVELGELEASAELE